MQNFKKNAHSRRQYLQLVKGDAGFRKKLLSGLDPLAFWSFAEGGGTASLIDALESYLPTLLRSNNQPRAKKK